MGKSGLLIVISAPSGGGKTTILNKLLEHDKDFKYSISATTRNKRLNEVDGEDYHFVTLSEFEEMKRKGLFVEWAEVHGDYYGTPVRPIMKWLEEGKFVFMDLDVDGGLQVKQKFRDKALLIFVQPPSYDRLLARLQSRNTETPQQIEKRLSRYPKEMKRGKQYDYQVVNENVDETTKEIIEIIKKHRIYI